MTSKKKKKARDAMKWEVEGFKAFCFDSLRTRTPQAGPC